MKIAIVLSVCLAVAFAGQPLPLRLRQLNETPKATCGNRFARYTGARIVGGRNALEGEFPFQCSLQRKSSFGSFSHSCGASILDATTVITAAHCVTSIQPANLRIVVGMYRRTGTTGYQSNHDIQAIRYHENYNSGTIDNDIAILKLVQPIQFKPNVDNVCLPAAGADTPGPVDVTGWGATREGGSLPDILQTVQVPVVDQAKCRSQYGQSAITDNMLCAGVDEGGKDSCQGDSGGPLTQEIDGEIQLHGIVSWGRGCARAGYAGVYTRVSRYNSWIAANRN